MVADESPSDAIEKDTDFEFASYELLFLVIAVLCIISVLLELILA
jgi:hypothetical protein